MRRLAVIISITLGCILLAVSWNKYRIKKMEEVLKDIPPPNSMFVNVLDRRWVAGIPINGPTRIWVVDGKDINRVSRPNTTQLDETGPEGITWGPYNPMPRIHETKVLVNPYYPYLALLGKVYKQVAGYWVPDAEQFLIGREVVICPATDNQKRTLAGRVNHFICLGRLCSDMVDNDLRGGYTVEFEAVDASWCEPTNTKPRQVFLR